MFVRTFPIDPRSARFCTHVRASACFRANADVCAVRCVFIFSKSSSLLILRNPLNKSIHTGF